MNNRLRGHPPRHIVALVFLALVAGCHGIHLPGPNVDRPEKDAVPEAPAKCSLRVSQFIFFSDFELKSDLPIFKELSGLRDQIYKELQLPTANRLVQVYLFEDRERYERFMHSQYPELPKRRAFFVAQQRCVGGAEDLLVYTYWGDRIQQDLRHELTHALLHSVLLDVPLWLDEGLAEYYELPLGWKGVNYQHLEQMRAGVVKPDLERLEQLSKVQQMTPAEYRESWAWVHLMLQSKPEAKAVLLAYLQQLRTNKNPGPLGPRLAGAVPGLEGALNKHLAAVDSRPRSEPR
ncbi:MAG: DUF1570 domain-containing protein [Gemmataceae bacterium]|nr:DUF1570 domain-containing protein [Gemmataceae bacterium]